MMTCEPSVRFNSSTIPPTSCGISTGTGLRSDRKSTRLNSSHLVISYAVFCLKKKKNKSIFLLCFPKSLIIMVVVHSLRCFYVSVRAYILEHSARGSTRYRHLIAHSPHTDLAS